MKYSEVLANFYQIVLCLEDQEWVDTFFTGAGHAFHRTREALANGDRWNGQFHHSRLRMHVVTLRGVVFSRGDFRFARDNSLRGLERRSTWTPKLNELPDPSMFDSFLPDGRFGLGEDHPADAYIVDVELERARRARLVS